MKICSKKDCIFGGQPQPFENFCKDNSKKSGLSSNCKTCRNKHNKVYYEKNEKEIKEQQKEYRGAHKEKKSKYQKRYYIKNKEEIKGYRKEHKEEIKKYNKWYKQLHRREINKQISKKRKEDPNFRIAELLRSRQRKLLASDIKIGSFVRDMGCVIGQLRQRFEQIFPLNPPDPILGLMSWKNQGRPNGQLGWDIDHIIPLSAFDLSDREQFLKAAHYTNLRPMWAKQNMSENDRGLSKKRKK